MTNHKFSLENAFQQILYKIDNWINTGSGWIVQLTSLNTLIFRLIERYQKVLAILIKLSVELKSSNKRLINITNSYQKCFFMVSC